MRSGWRFAVLMLVGTSAVFGEAITEFPLDAYATADLPVSREITTITLPGPITAVVGADMLIDDGKAAGVDIEEGTPVRFQVTHAPGSNFVLVRSVQPAATGRLTVLFEGAAYVMQLRSVESDSIASAIFKRPAAMDAAKLTRLPEPVRFTSRIGLSLLDRARAYPVLVNALPHAVEGVSPGAHGRKIDLPDLEIEVREVYRFAKEDAVVFLLTLYNKTDDELAIDPGTFAARVGSEKFQQAIATGPRELAPGGTAEAEFAIVGMADGTRNDLSADNAFTILVESARHAPQTADASR